MVGGVGGVKREPEDLTRRSISPSDRMVVDRRRTVFLPPVSDGSSPRLDQATKEELEAQIKEEGGDRPRGTQTTFVIAATSQSVETGDKMTSSYLGFPTAPSQSPYEHVPPYLSPSPQSYTTTAPPAAIRGSSTYAAVSDQYYSEYYRSTSEPQYTLARPEYPVTSETDFDRYSRPGTIYKTLNLTVDSSPDSGTSSDPGREQALFVPQVIYLPFRLYVPI